MKNVEIERKYLVKKENLPKNYKKYKSYKIIQGFIYYRPVIRIRNANANYSMTIKDRISLSGLKIKDLARKEYEFDISKKTFDKLSESVNGRFIYKTRYNIPYKIGGKTYTIELDIFEKDYKGLVYAEVEFKNVKDANKFIAPDWFYKDVTGIERYKNTALSICKNPKSVIKY